ncbi:MAG: shikimate dehydrogenase family protein [Gemmatimonadaceae bacterium]
MKRPARLVLLGHPVAHSLSPRMQNAALAAAGIGVHYSVLDVEPPGISVVIDELRKEGGAGNVTIPHKQTVFALCGRVTEVARTTHGVNTFWFEEGALVGTNTDVGGFDGAARNLMTQNGRALPRRVTLLGAGGSAAAVATAISGWQGTELTIWSRTEHSASNLAQRFDCAHAERDLTLAVAGAELIVNATPIGLTDDLLPVPIELLGPDAAVMDLVYRARDTPWVRAARSAGLPAVDGLPMLVEQGALAFECWFGFAPDRRVMWEAAVA